MSFGKHSFGEEKELELGSEHTKMALSKHFFFTKGSGSSLSFFLIAQARECSSIPGI